MVLTIREGSKTMPPFAAALTPEQIQAVSAYVVEGLEREALTDLVVTPGGEFLGIATLLDAGELANVTANGWAGTRASAFRTGMLK